MLQMVDEKTDDHTTVKRNYRSVYKWAQRNSPINLFFLSKEWLQSDNCTVELDDMKDPLYYENSERMVILVFLDQFEGEDEAKVDRYSTDLRALYVRRRSFWRVVCMTYFILRAILTKTHYLLVVNLSSSLPIGMGPRDLKPSIFRLT